MSTHPAFLAPFIPPRPNLLRAPQTQPRRSTPLAVANPALPHTLPPEQLSKRSEELEQNRKLYIYESPPTIPKIAFIKGPVDALPGQQPTFWWKTKAAAASARIVLNFNSVLKAGNLLFTAIFTDQKDTAKVQSTLQSFTDSINPGKAADDAMKKFRQARLGSSQFEEKHPALEPYRDMYRTLPQPAIGDNFLEDRVFARLRIAGYNPISLNRVRSVEQLPFQIYDTDLPSVGDTLASAIAEKRLYYNDFSFLAGVEQQRNSNKICCVSKSIFVVPPGGGDLKPVAIQVNGDIVHPPKAGSAPSTRWAIAKMALNNADAIHHELIAHLGRTHLLVEPFVAATMRQLPSTHPLHVLLKPHFEGTVFINDTASRNLVAPGGDVDRIFAGEIDSVMKWCGNEVVNFRFNSCMPDVEIKARGVDDPILYFPYREDALAHFNALYEWVYSYLSYYYKSDTEIIMDIELQAWAAELVDPARGRVKEFGDNGSGKVSTVRYLARAVAFVIFSGSVQHAAVNFPQMSLMSYAPAIAGGLYSVPPKAGDKSGLDKWAETLTPVKVAIEQIQILDVIGAVYYTKLGKYRSSELPKVREIRKAHNTYLQKLKDIDRRIAKREKNAELPYEYLRPDNIPQSINI